MDEMKTIQLGATVEENDTDSVGLVYDVVLDGKARTIHYLVLGRDFDPKRPYTVEELYVLADPTDNTIAEVEEYLSPTPKPSWMQNKPSTYRNLWGRLNAIIFGDTPPREFL